MEVTELLKEYENGNRDFSGANLSGANLSGAMLAGVNLSRANLSGANLSRANLTKAELNEANLYRANLSFAKNGPSQTSGWRAHESQSQRSFPRQSKTAQGKVEWRPTHR